jgi:predicted NAD-dependent protein-ADP-ribosyltransferase YbiA (DUF1768 family)
MGCSRGISPRGGARLVEAGTTDNEVNRRWGEVNGKGQNWLGLILMEIRAEVAEIRAELVPGG